jgi:hypothetical protein
LHLQLHDRLSFSANLRALQVNGSLRLHQKTPEILLPHEQSNTAAEVRPSMRRDAKPLGWLCDLSGSSLLNRATLGKRYW